MSRKREEFRNNIKLTDNEMRAFIKHVNKNMRDYEKNIKTRMEQSDRAELQTNKAKTDVEEIDYM